MALQGADVEEMARLAKRLETASSQLHRITSQATIAANNIAQLWVGPDAVEIQRLWATQHRPRLVAAANALVEAAATVERNRQAQQATSDTLLDAGTAGTAQPKGTG